MINNWASIIQSCFIPSRCVLCGVNTNDSRDLCGDCAQELPYNNPACKICALPLVSPLISKGLDVCGQCLQAPPHFSRCISLFKYTEPVSQLILRLKYNRKMFLARLFGEMMVERLRDQTNLPSIIMPVPLHISRLRQRGFNQALEIAKPIARRLKMKIDWRSCYRRRDTQSQALLPLKERQINISGAFKINGNISHESVAIIDDVMTTSNTANEMARVLLEAGVAQVDVWVYARASLD